MHCVYLACESDEVLLARWATDTNRRLTDRLHKPCLITEADGQHLFFSRIIAFPIDYFN